MRWRPLLYLALAVGGVGGAYVLVWMPCLGSMLALAALGLGVTAVLSSFGARRAARRANEPSALATAALIASVTALPVIAAASIGCATLNAAVTAVSAASTIAPAAAAAILLPHSPGSRSSSAEEEHRAAESFWNGGYAGDWAPTDVGMGEDEGDVRRTIRVGAPFVVLAAFLLVALANGDDEETPTPAVGEPAPDAGVDAAP